MTKPADELLDFHRKVRETVTIMRPMPSVRPRGTNTERERQPTRSMRIYKEQLEAIDEAAKLLGMTRSAFMSWCAYYVAVDTIQQYKEYKER